MRLIKQYETYGVEAIKSLIEYYKDNNITKIFQ